ncbi:helicase sen1-like [Belonocnema kinseyi]|uniref:helicase sen1-like n=1 Tax=Belonocnema kinseyi TaxID=2817044 RepID=UPI00143DAC63|nr:helicase sen1-like [Belonocnema kinseyi]
MEIHEYSLKRIYGKNSAESNAVISLKDRTKKYTCGRTGRNDIICIHKKISKRHCEFSQANNVLFVKDFGSTNGVYVNGTRIPSNMEVSLKELDIISLSTEDIASEDENDFIYRVYKQVSADNKPTIKTEKPSASKVSKMRHKESMTEAVERMAVEKLGADKRTHITPSIVTSEGNLNQPCIKMNIELCITGTEGVLPNIYVNQCPTNPHEINIAMEPTMQQENAMKTEVEKNVGISSTIPQLIIPSVSQLTTSATVSPFTTTPSVKKMTASSIKNEVIMIDLCDDNNFSSFKNGDLAELNSHETNCEILGITECKLETKYDIFEQTHIVESETDIEIVEVLKKDKKKKNKEKKKRKKEKKRKDGKRDEKRRENMENIEEMKEKKIKISKNMDGETYSNFKSTIVGDVEKKHEGMQNAKLSPLSMRIETQTSQNNPPPNSTKCKTVGYECKERNIKQFQLEIGIEQREMPKCQALYQKIVSWDPQTFAGWYSNPFSLKEEEFKPVSKSYESYENYCSVFLPLVMLEIFHSIKNAYVNVKRSLSFADCEIVLGSVKKEFINEEFADMLKFQIKITSKTPAYKFPKLGDLLQLEMRIPQVETPTILFAYVLFHQYLSLQKDRSTEEDYLQGLYTVVTKELDLIAYKSKIIKLRIVLNLHYFMQLSNAMDYLRNSPLMPIMIKPELEKFNLLFSSCTTTLVSKDKLDGKQLNAVMKIIEVAARREPKIVLIEGPPGTGKTQVIVNIILQLLNDEVKIQDEVPMKIMVCASTEPAVDEIVLRISSILQTLKRKTVKMTRLGEFEQMDSKTRKFSLKEMSEQYLQQKFHNFCSKEIEFPRDQEMIRLIEEIQEAKKLIRDTKSLGAALALPVLEKFLEMKVGGRMVRNISSEEYEVILGKVKEVYLSAHNLITCSLLTCYSPIMDVAFSEKNLIPVCIIDEATLVHEVDILQLLSFGVKTLILVGDTHKHSTKSLSSPTLRKLGMGDSLFSRIKRNFTNPKYYPIMTLDQEYRMNPEISHFPNSFFYKGILTNRRTKPNHCSISPYKMFNFKNLDEPAEIEAYFAVNLILCIIKYANVKDITKPLSIAVVVPYNTSKILITKAIHQKLHDIPKEERGGFSIDVDTINGFQNQERDIVFASCIEQKGIQFLTGEQRLYSTLTIARHCLILYGEFKKIQDESRCMWNSLIEDAKRRKLYIDVDCKADFSTLKEYVIRS